MQEKIARNDSEISPYGLSTCREIAKKITHVERERERERERVCRDDPCRGANNTMMHDQIGIFTMHVKLTKHAETCNIEDERRL